MPDIDVDFCYERRDEVIRYVREKYGEDRVAQIITFGTLKGKAAIKDVGRVLDFTFGETDRIAKLYPGAEAGEGLPARRRRSRWSRGCAELRDASEREQRLFDLRAPPRGPAAPRVEARRRHRHLEPPAHRRPAALRRQGRRRRHAVLATATSSAIGLIKFDFLGLKTLTLIADIVQLHHASGTAARPSISTTLPLDDATTYKLLAKGDTIGVFQME